MVFKHVAVYLLDKYLGDYIQNLDTKKLKIDLWEGDVVLEKLYLKADALTNWNIPVTIITGYCEKLSLHISWKHFYTHPMKITIDGFYLLVEPNTEIKSNPEKEEKEEYDAKMKEVHKIEEFSKEREEFENSKKLPKHKDTFLERCKFHLIRNLQISINNIHIAFEDKTTKPSHPFACGITLNYFQLLTTNSSWEPMTLNDDFPFIYKIGEINNLSIYWNSNVQPRDLNTKIIRNDRTLLEKMTYILPPSNIKGKLKIARKQDYIESVFDVEDIHFNINRDQYSDLLELLEVRDYIKLKSKYIKYYPTNETDRPSLRRWKFAYAVIINENIRPRRKFYKWENILANLNRCREYHILYVRELSNQSTNEEKQRVQELEKQLDVLNLVFIRRTAELEVRKNKAEPKPKSWWDSLCNWWNKNSKNTDTDSNSENVMTLDEKKKLYDAIGYEDDHKPSSYPEEYVDIDLSIRINLLEVNVWSNIKENDSQLKVIARASVSKTDLTFQRRPATSAFLVILDIDSLGMYGNNEDYPALLQPANRSEFPLKKLLHFEFETNPLNTNADYRIETLLQPLEIVYDAVTINRLIEYFQPAAHQNLKSVKKAAYSIYSDIKHQTQFLLNYHLRNIKGLDIHIDLQSPYFLLPENGIHRNDCAAICLDFGHLTVQSGFNEIDEDIFEDAQEFIDPNDLLYIPLKVRLEDIRLLYAKPSKDWENVRDERDSPMHLIFPMTIGLDVFKCIDIDNALLPLWKIDAYVSPVEFHLSDIRVLEVKKLIQSIPLPQSKKSSRDSQTLEELFLSEGVIPEKDTKLTFQTIENMAPVKKNLQEAHNAEEGEQIEDENDNSKEQFIELEATLNIPRIDLLIEESLSDECNDTQPFVRISLISITAQTTMKTFDIVFDASLNDFIILHQQFLTNNNEPLRLFSTAHKEKLLNVKCLLTSPENPLFYSSPYNSIENKVQLHISKPIAMLQMEALLSILRFRNDLMEKLSKQSRRQSNSKEDAKPKTISDISTWEIEVDLKQFRAIVGTELSQILDIQLQRLLINASQSARKTSIDLILKDIHVFDLHVDSRYNKIIISKNRQKQLFNMELSLYNYSKSYKKTLDEVDCDLKIHLTKMNIIFLYKYIDLVLNIVNAFKTKKTAVSSTDKSSPLSPLENFKIRFNITLNAPTIFIPINSHSSEGIYINLGQLKLKTHFLDDLEQQILIFKNLRITRLNLNTNDEILGDILLFQSTDFQAYINRFQSEISVKIEWETIDLTLSKADYSSLMKIYKENFSETIPQKNFQPIVTAESVSSNVAPSVSDEQISKTIRLDFEIKKISLAFFSGESNLNERRAIRNEKSKFVDMEIEMIHANFEQFSDSSYYAKAQIQNVLFNDLRETNPPILGRSFHVDRNTQIFFVTVEFKPENQANVRQVNVELESLSLCLDPDCLMALKEFFISNDEDKSPPLINNAQSSRDVKDDLPLPAKSISTPRQSTSTNSTQCTSFLASSNTKDGIETRINASIKTPKIIWIENHDDANSNCLILSGSFEIRTIIEQGETHLDGWIKDLTSYICDYSQLNDLKSKCDLLERFDVNVVWIMDSEKQKFDIQIEEITVNIAPAAVRTIVGMVKSINKLTPIKSDKKEKVNSKSLFDPKLLKNAPFWFIEDMTEKTDVLEVTTGIPSHKKSQVEDKNEKFRSQEITFNLKLIECKFKLASDSMTKSVIAICLSEVFFDVENWSSDMNIESRIQLELALFNDHILAWEPLIDPIVDERGDVVTPWCITCSTTSEEDENLYQAERKSRKHSIRVNFFHSDKQFLCTHRQSSSNPDEETADIGDNLNAKTKFYIQTSSLLNLTLTKTSIDLFQRLSKMFTDAYKKELPTPDESILSIHNMTGYEIIIDDVNGIEFAENNKSENSISLKNEESVSMTVPGERLSATHLPAIAEQIAKRRQELSVKIGDNSLKVDINQTWRRVYELRASSILDWPIQMLCDSRISQDRRRIILSSIIKIYNKTIMPLSILDVDSIEMKTFNTICRIDVDEEYYLPIEPLYMCATPRLFVAIDDNDFISFDWLNETTMNRVLKTKDDEKIHLVIYKDSCKAYSENTDEPIRTCFDVYINLALRLVNLLPIDVQCSIDDNDPIDLKPGESYPSRSGHKKSVLIYTIPSYNNMKWISEPVDLSAEGHESRHEHIVEFNADDTQDILRMILRVDVYRESYRASLFSPFWFINCTNLKFEFKMGNDKTSIDVNDRPCFVCLKKSDSKAEKKKGQIRVYSIEEDETVSQWSEDFAVHVLKHTGLTSCKVVNDRIYTICVSIVACSFGMSRIVTLSPSMTIFNNSTIELEVIEIVSGIEQDDWKLLKPDEIIPFWSRDIKNGVMCVRYAHNQVQSSTFLLNNNHRTLLRMDDEDRPALHVEITVTDIYGIHTVFGDYKIGDAPILLVNCLRNLPVTYSQKDETENQLLPAQHYVYYTWIDPFKSHEVFFSCNNQDTTVKLQHTCRQLGSDDENPVFYAVFHDGPQTVLIFAESQSIVDVISGIPSLNQPMTQYIEINLREIGISIVNDLTRTDLFYITINKSKEIWIEIQHSLIKPLSRELNDHLEKNYQIHLKHLKVNPNDKTFEQKKYHIEKHRYASFDEGIAELSDHKGHQIYVYRQALDGLRIEYAWSKSNAALHVQINHIQIDDQLDCTMFPVVLHPIVSKAIGTDIPGKPFIELNVFKTIVARSNTVHFKYFKLLIQEFALRVDQGLIVSIFAFIKPEKKCAAPRINMAKDLKRLEKPLETLIKGQIENQSEETKIYFDYIHLSPLKIHVSFSMYGVKPTDELVAEHPLAEFLLHILNVAEIDDVILKLNHYDRKQERFTITKLRTEMLTHYEYQFLKQIHAVVLGLNVLGNPLGVVRGVSQGVQAFFYQPYQGAMEGPTEFIEGIASGTEYLVASAVGGVAGAGSKISGVISKGLATLTFDEDYQTARIQRKELTIQTTSDIFRSGKNVIKDVVHSVKNVVRKPVTGGKEDGTPGFIKGLGKGFIGLVARPTSGVADLTSTSFDVLKRTVTHEEIVHRVRRPRHIGRDGIVRPSLAYATMGAFIFQRLDIEKYIKSDDYLAHISCSGDEVGWLLATTKHLIFASESSSDSNVYEVEWHFRYKELNGVPVVKFDPDQIEIILKEPKVFGRLNKDRAHKKTITCQNVGEARYIVDTITETMHAKELVTFSSYSNNIVDSED